MKTIRDIGLGQYCWIFVEKLIEPGRETYQVKPRVVTESYFDLLGNGELQHTIQVADWDIVTPEALWVGSKQLAEKVINCLNKHMRIQCQIRALPKSMINSKTGSLNFQEPYIMEKLIQSVGPGVTSTPLAHEPASKEFPQDIENHGSKGKIYLLGRIILDRKLTRSLIFQEHEPIDYVNMYYYRDEDNPPMYENILEYPVCLVRFNPRVAKGWRYMCSLTTYANLVREQFTHVIQKGWNVPFSREMVEEVLNDEHLFPDLMIDIAGSIIWEAEVFGNTADLINSD
jgi:hypothetical protein